MLFSMENAALILRHTIIICCFGFLACNGGGGGGGNSGGTGPENNSSDTMALWSKNFGAAGIETNRAVVSHPNGDFLLAGETTTFSDGKSNAWFMNVDSEGNTIWANAAGADDLGLSNVLGITPSDDGGTFICGEILDSNTGNVDRLVAKLSANGGILWMRKSGEPEPSHERAIAVADTMDGGCVIAGTANAGSGDWQIQVAKFDSSGEVEWVYTNPVLGIATCIVQTNEGDYLVGGHSADAGPKKPFVLALNDSGSHAYSNFLVSADGNDYTVLRIAENQISGAVLTAYCETNDTVNAFIFDTSGTPTDHYFTNPTEEFILLEPTSGSQFIMLATNGTLCKLDSNFEVTWCVSVSIANVDTFARACMTGPNQYAVLGLLETGENFIVDLEVDSNGTQLQQSYNLVADASEFVLANSEGSGGEFYIGGSKSDGGWISKLNAARNREWSITSREGTSDYINDACLSSPASSFDGYVLAGSTPSAENGDNNLWIYAIDTSGRLQWEKIYSQPESDDVARAIVATEDGYLIAGQITYNGDPFALIMKLDAAGDIIVENAFIEIDSVENITQTVDGEVLFTGSKDGEILWARSDADLNLIRIGKIGREGGMYEPTAILETPGHGCLIVGTTTSEGAGGQDIFLVSLDSSGNIVWQNTYGGIGDEIAAGMVEDPSGGYVVAGTTTSWGGGNNCGDGICPNYFAMHVSVIGEVEWLRTYSTAGSDVAYDICAGPGGGYLIGGASDGITGDNDFWSVRTDTWGHIVETCPSGIATDQTATINPGLAIAGSTGFTFVYNDHSPLEDPHLPYTTDGYSEGRQCSGILDLWNLSVTVSGNGDIISDPTGISCGEICDNNFISRQVVTLSAYPDPGWDFDHWSGDCSGTSNIETVTMNDDRNCIAHFVSQDAPSLPEVLTDDFDDESLDPNWILSADFTQNDVDGWTYQETGSELVATEVLPVSLHNTNGGEYSRLLLYRELTPLTDFTVEFDISWEAADNTAMQYLGVYLYAANGGTRIATASYGDAWVATSGQMVAEAGGDLFQSGYGTLQNVGAASIKIHRSGSTIDIYWDGEQIHTGESSEDFGRFYIIFAHYPFDTGQGLSSSFGTESVDLIRISGTPAQ